MTPCVSLWNIKLASARASDPRRQDRSNGVIDTMYKIDYYWEPTVYLGESYSMLCSDLPGKKIQKSWFALLYSRNWHNIVKLLRPLLKSHKLSFPQYPIGYIDWLHGRRLTRCGHQEAEILEANYHSLYLPLSVLMVMSTESSAWQIVKVLYIVTGLRKERKEKGRRAKGNNDEEKKEL